MFATRNEVLALVYYISEVVIANSLNFPGSLNDILRLHEHEKIIKNLEDRIIEKAMNETSAEMKTMKYALETMEIF